MAFRKLSDWFLTETGKTFTFGVSLTGVVGTFCSYYVPNTFCISQYKDIVQLYRHGISVPVPKVLSDRFQKALELAKISEQSSRMFSCFSVVGFDIFSAGSTFSRFGCIIGLPINFTYVNVDRIAKSDIKILGESVVWDREDAKDFLNSLVLSEKAQVYAIAREMRMIDSMKLPFDASWASFCAFMAYSINNTLNVKFNMYSKPQQLRLIMYTLVGMFVVTNYLFIKDFMQLYYEHRVDEELKELNPYLVEGAIEFYAKILQRNKALRSLMGSQGESTYSILGNENYTLRQKHLPIVQRKSFFDNTLKAEDSYFKISN